MERRYVGDRRRFRRGGRRSDDADRQSPLVLIIEPHAARRALTDVALTMRHFAVAAVDSVNGAVAVCRDVMPTVIICDEAHASRLRETLGPLTRVAIVSDTPDEGAPTDLIERLRRAIRDESVAPI